MNRELPVIYLNKMALEMAFDMVQLIYGYKDSALPAFVWVLF
jgi:hypothetical protein